MINKSFLKKSIAALVIVVAVFTRIPVAFANDGVLGFTPEGVYPITQSDISMTSEEIHIQLTDYAKARVTCRFDFRNFGKAQTVLMGFPAQLNETGELSPDEVFWVHNFTARDEDGDLEVTLADTIPNPPIKYGMEKYKKWYCFSVDFDKGESKTLYHTYEISFPYVSTGHVSMGYVLETGSLWKGPLGHSKVIFDFGDIPMYTLEGIYPNNFFRIDGNQLIWERKDFKPSYNLKVVTNCSLHSDERIKMYEENGLPEEVKLLKEKIEFFSTPPETIQKNSDLYYEEYKTLIKEDQIRALYIKSALGLPNGNEKPEIVECSAEPKQDYWFLSISGTDPDGDVVSLRTVIEGLDTTRIYDDHDVETSYYSGNGEQFGYATYVKAEENTPISVTFIVSDSYGNFDTKTIILQAEHSEPSAAATQQTPDEPIEEESAKEEPAEEKPTEEETGEEAHALYASQTIQEEPSKIQKANLFHMVEETVPLLVTGVAIVLLLCIAAVIYLLIKRKNKGYILFILQFIFLAFAFIRVVGILTMKADTTMLSEHISLGIGLSAVFWALSMTCMIAGIFVIGKTNS